MEGMIKSLFALLILVSTTSLLAQTPEPKKEVVGVFYFNKTYGHIHQSSSRYSSVLTNVSCGHPVRVHRLGNTDTFGSGWKLVSTGPYEGYVEQSFLSDKKVPCLQDKYPKFFEALNLDISDMYYWGRLQDQLARGESGLPLNSGGGQR